MGRGFKMGSRGRGGSGRGSKWRARDRPGGSSKGYRGQHLEVVIDRPCSSTLVLIHSSELSQAESKSHRVTNLYINPNKLSSNSSVVQLHRCVGLVGRIQP